jgi:hypothetical protein
MADGRIIADAAASEILAGGWYFATETARILGGAGGVLLPEQGAELLRARAPRDGSPADRAASSSVGAAASVGHHGDAALQAAATVARGVAR